MRKNWLTTTAGIMAALGGVPVLVAQSGAHLPAWWSSAAFVFVLIGVIGVALLGVAAKGQDEHSTSDQVQMSTIEKHVDQQIQAQQQNKSAGA
jgi:hypothetical protein